MQLQIGSRKSKLAVIQAEWVKAELIKVEPSLEVTLQGITTEGDRDQQSSLQSIGGKGVFVKDIEGALLRMEIDLAVHSLKDVPQTLPAGLTLGPFPKREDPREALISKSGKKLKDLFSGAVIGTSSPRRETQIKFQFGEKFQFKPLRGNVETRIKKLDEGEYDALIMAVSGLKRIGLASLITEIIEPGILMPAPCQGCLGLELRAEDSRTLELLQKIKDPVSNITALAERAFLSRLGGNCLVPVGSFTEVRGDRLVMRAIILDNEGKKAARAEYSGDITSAGPAGRKLAEDLLANGGASLLGSL